MYVNFYIMKSIIILLFKFIITAVTKKNYDFLIVMKLNEKSVNFKILNGQKIYSEGLS